MRNKWRKKCCAVILQQCGATKNPHADLQDKAKIKSVREQVRDEAGVTAAAVMAPLVAHLCPFSLWIRLDHQDNCCRCTSGAPRTCELWTQSLSLVLKSCWSCLWCWRYVWAGMNPCGAACLPCSESQNAHKIQTAAPTIDTAIKPVNSFYPFIILI